MMEAWGQQHPIRFFHFEYLHKNLSCLPSAIFYLSPPYDLRKISTPLRVLLLTQGRGKRGTVPFTVPKMLGYTARPRTTFSCLKVIKRGLIMICRVLRNRSTIRFHLRYSFTGGTFFLSF